MRCPNCSTENPANAKLCFNCGTPFAARCTNCGAEVPAGGRFCMNCGQPVVGSTAIDDARHARLTAAAPAPLAKKMRAAHLAGERKLVTALFADVVGSTALTAQMDPEDWTAIIWAEGHCLSYGQGLAYQLLIDLLRSLLGVPATASEPDTRAALAAVTRGLFGDSAIDVYPYLAHLLSLQIEGAALERVKALDPQAMQAQYRAAMRQLLLSLVARDPLVWVLDDIHWADPSSVDLLSQLLPLATEAPLLFCVVSRPDRDAPGWKLISAARDQLGASLSEIILNPLSDADSQQLVSNLLEVEALPHSIRARILEKAEGNPFFSGGGDPHVD